MSLPIIDSAALAIVRQTGSPMPIDQMPGFLSRAINLHATRGETIIGSANKVHKRRAKTAMEQQSSCGPDLKAVQNRHQP